jgi:hypothetical protein
MNAFLFNVHYHTSVLIVVVYFHGVGLTDNSMHVSPNSWHGLGNVDTVDNTGQTGNISTVLKVNKLMAHFKCLSWHRKK